MKFNKTLLLTLLALPITACATNDGLLSNYGSNRPAWLNKLQQLNHTSDGKFRIIQVGDSHTAGDYFTDRLRRRLQQKWGNGGIGWVYPNTVKGQRMATVRYNGSGWNTISSRKSHSDFSFGGIEARADGGSVTLSAADGSMDMQQISIFGKPVWSEQTLTVNGREIPATQNGWQLLRTNASLPMTLSSSMLGKSVSLISTPRTRRNRFRHGHQRRAIIPMVKMAPGYVGGFGTNQSRFNHPCLRY